MKENSSIFLEWKYFFRIVSSCFDKTFSINTFSLFILIIWKMSARNFLLRNLVILITRITSPVSSDYSVRFYWIAAQIKSRHFFSKYLFYYHSWSLLVDRYRCLSLIYRGPVDKRWKLRLMDLYELWKATASLTFRIVNFDAQSPRNE